MVNINFFAGPGTGKSTMSAGLFHHMKKKDYKVEYIQEYAKELTFGKDFTRLGDQLLILGEQHHRMHRLKGQLDFLIHDSPFVMGMTYLQDDIHLPKKTYKKLITKMFKSYNNINIFLERDTGAHKYQEYGRTQTLEDAIKKDAEIKEMLIKNNIPFTVVKMGKKAVKEVYGIVKDYNEKLYNEEV